MLAPTALLLTVVGCSGGSGEDAVGRTTEAAISSASLDLKILTNSCGANQVQDFFQIKNTGTTSVALSDITIKLWVNDTSASNLTASISTGGCVNNGTNCVHQVTGAAATVTPFSPACGPDANHLANREVTLSTSDHTLLPPGQTWTNLQSALRLASSANFSPGTSTWFSSCLSGTQYKSDPHFVLYYKGNLVYTSSGITPPTCRAPQGSQKLTGYVPAELAALPLVGPLPQSTIVHLGVALPVQNATALQTFIQQVTDPNSPSYRAYLTPDEFTATYAPTQTAFQSLVTWATANGLTVDNPNSSSRMLLNVHGTAASVAKAVYANFVQRSRADGSQFYMLDREPSLDLGAAVLRISGLDNFKTSSKALTAFGSGQQKTFTGQDFRDLYAGCTKNTGGGQQVALLAGSGYNPLAVAAYAAADGISAPPIVPVLLDGADGTPDGDVSTEVETDIEMVMGMAPGLDQIVVYEAPLFGDSPTVAANAILDAITTQTPLAYQVSSSYIYATDATTQQLSNKLVALGQSLFQSSGDGGATTADGHNDSVSALWGETLVGGTILQPDEEIAWGASGGGQLSRTQIPDYQAGIDMSLNGGSTTHRNYPDVAMNAWNVETFQNGGDFVTSMGTSISTPLWAAFTALINQQGHKHGNPPLGFLNPVVYAVGRTPDLYASTFTDIQSGSNALNGNPGYDAVAGYDLVTGWGSPTCALITQLGRGKPLTPTRIGISSGPFGRCAMSSDGSLECWGSNQFGPLVDGAGDVATPASVPGLGAVVDVSTGNSHSCAVTRDGKVDCWGANTSGQLGDGTTTNRTTPVEVQGLTDAVSVSVGYDHTCAVRSNLTVVCWGDNSHGELGDGTTTSSTTPVAVGGPIGVLSVTCGHSFSCARDSTRSVYCWGSDENGKLGDSVGDAELADHSTPIEVPGLPYTQALSAAGESVCALANGTLFCWGLDGFGFLGTPGSQHRSQPYEPGLDGGTQVATGTTNVCVTMNDGTAQCAGANGFGQVGTGATSTTAPLSQVQGLGDVAKIVPGLASTCAMTSDGSVYCWGGSDNGALGFDTPPASDVLTPTQVSF
jgi:alpha-tubulin suppressor-like RCC1 family protein